VGAFNFFVIVFVDGWKWESLVFWCSMVFYGFIQQERAQGRVDGSCMNESGRCSLHFSRLRERVRELLYDSEEDIVR